MNPVLHLSSWPSAIETVLPRDTLRVGWISNAWDDSLPAIVQSVVKDVVVPVDFYLFDHGDADCAVRRPPIRACGLRSESAAKILFSLDAVMLDERVAPDWWETLARWAIPPILLSQVPDTPGLTVHVGNLPQIADTCVGILTDPASRRAHLAPFRANATQRESAQVWRIEGVFDSSYSLALVNRQLALALSDSTQRAVELLTYEQGTEPDLSLEHVPDSERSGVTECWDRGRQLERAPDLSLRNAWPPSVQGMRGHLRVLANYHWEETRFPRGFAKAFNRTLDLITVGSSQTARFLEDAGVNVPMAIVGDGVDHLLEKPAEPLPQLLPDGFKFLHVSSCFPRKAVDVLLASFGAAFADCGDVSLVIKTFPNPHNAIQQQLAQFRSAYPSGPEVVVIEGDWSESQMAGLYEACDAYVAPSRGEGFGLPLAEAMLYGLPVITTDWGGHRDFCTPDNTWLVRSELEPADTHLSLSGSLWAEPDQAALTEKLREVHQADDALIEEKTRRAHATAASLTWEAVVARTERAVERVLERTGPTPATRLGWITTWGTRCGIASYSRHMTGQLRSGGALAHQCDLTVLAPKNDFPEREDEPDVDRCWLRGAINPATELIRHLIELDIEAVVLQHHWSFLSPEILADTIRALSGAGIPVFLDMHNTRGAPEGIADDYNLIHGLSRCARILLHTQDDMAQASGWGLKDNLTLFPLAAYPIEQASPDRLSQLRAHLELDGKRVIASYGFLMGHKGILELVHSLPEILKSEPDAHLLLVNALYSEAVSGPVRDELEQAIDELGITDSVTCIWDYLPDEESMALLQLADIVVYPYRESTESSSAAVRMAISGRCLIAITPVHLFADVASGCNTLPGTSPMDMAKGLVDLLARCQDPAWREERRRKVDELAAEIDAGELGDRLLGMVQGHLRRLDLR